TLLYEALPYCEAVTTDMQWIIPGVYNLIGNNFHYSGYSDSALIYYTQALRFLDSLNIDKPHLVAQVTSNIGATLATSRQYKQAADYMVRTINTLQKSYRAGKFNRNDSILLALNYGNYGSWHANYKGDRDSAQYWWSQAIPIYKNLGMKD